MSQDSQHSHAKYTVTFSSDAGLTPHESADEPEEQQPAASAKLSANPSAGEGTSQTQAQAQDRAAAASESASENAAQPETPAAPKPEEPAEPDHSEAFLFAQGPSSATPKPFPADAGDFCAAEAIALITAASPGEQATTGASPKSSPGTSPEGEHSHSHHHGETSVEENGETLRRVRKKKRHAKKKSKAGKIAKRVGIVVLIVIVIAAIAAFALVKTGESNFKKQVDYTEGVVIEHNGYTYKLNENIVSICFIGYDQTVSDRGKGKAGQADVIMVITMDVSNGKVKIVNIPRDSMVEVDEMVGEDFLGVETMQACLAFAFGDASHKSCEYTIRVAQRVLYNMPISYYFALNMDGVAPLNNAIGGVTLVPLTTISSVGIYEGQEMTLWGNQAIAYVRSRDTDFEASSERQKRQIQYVQAYAQQALECAKGDPGVLVDLFNIGAEYSITNLGTAEVSYLASLLMQFGVGDIEIVNLQGTTTQPGTYAEFILDQDAVYQTVLDTFYINMGPIEQEEEGEGTK